MPSRASSPDTNCSRSRGPTAHPSRHLGLHLRLGPGGLRRSNDVGDAFARLKHHAIRQIPLLRGRQRAQCPHGHRVQSLDSARIQNHAVSVEARSVFTEERAQIPTNPGGLACGRGKASRGPLATFHTHPSKTSSSRSSARSMMPKPSAICASLMHSGGLHMSVLHCSTVNRPLSFRNLPTLGITGCVPA